MMVAETTVPASANRTRRSLSVAPKLRLPTYNFFPIENTPIMRKRGTAQADPLETKSSVSNTDESLRTDEE
jgi:hypothetical protein